MNIKNTQNTLILASTLILLISMLSLASNAAIAQNEQANPKLTNPSITQKQGAIQNLEKIVIKTCFSFNNENKNNPLFYTCQLNKQQVEQTNKYLKGLKIA